MRPGTSGIRNNYKNVNKAAEKRKGRKGINKSFDRESDSESGSEEEREIFFNCANCNESNSKENGNSKEKLNLSDFADECEIAQSDEDFEEASMRKFAKFLEKNGYIKKVDDVPNSGSKEKQVRHKQPRNEGDVGVSNANENKIASHSQGSASDITVYRGLLLLTFQVKT